MKKIIALVLVLVLALTAIGGTLAYFSDTEEAENVFTVGSVDISLYEHEEEVTDPDQTPAEYQDWLDEELKDDPMVPGDEYPKYVYVKNTGENDAYVRVTITVPADLVATLPATAPNGWTMETKNGVTTFISTTAMEPDVVAGPLLLKVKMDPAITELNAETVYDVDVKVDAIQADGFEDASVALAEYDKATNIAQREAHADVTRLNEALEKDNVVVQLSDNVKGAEAIEMGGNNILDGNNNTLTRNAAEGTTQNAAILATGGTIKNITIEGETVGDKGFRSIYVTAGLKSDLTIENAILNGTYALNITGDSSDYNLVVRDSVMNGWTSYDDVKSATFDTVKFRGTGSNNVLRPYCDTTLINCDFNANYDLCNGDKVENLVITMNNCTVAGEKLTAANAATKLYLNDFVGTLIIDGVAVEIGTATE